MQSQRHPLSYPQIPPPNPYCEPTLSPLNSSISSNRPICLCRLPQCRSGSLGDFSPNWEDGRYLLETNVFICLVIALRFTRSARSKQSYSKYVGVARVPQGDVIRESKTPTMSPYLFHKVFYLLFLKIILIHQNNGVCIERVSFKFWSCHRSSLSKNVANKRILSRNRTVSCELLRIYYTG